MSNDEAVFPKGIFFKKPHENAPDFVKGQISIKGEELIPFLKEHQNEAGYVNIDLKVSKAGKLYLQLNTYKSEKKPDPQEEYSTISEEDSPF